MRAEALDEPTDHGGDSLNLIPLHYRASLSTRGLKAQEVRADMAIMQSAESPNQRRDSAEPCQPTDTSAASSFPADGDSAPAPSLYEAVVLAQSTGQMGPIHPRLARQLAEGHARRTQPHAR